MLTNKVEQLEEEVASSEIKQEVSVRVWLGSRVVCIFIHMGVLAALT